VWWPARLMHRHRRPGAEHPRFIAGAGHHTPATQAADQHRPALQRRSGELFDGGEERVHVQVQYPAGLHNCKCYWSNVVEYGDERLPPAVLRLEPLGEGS